MIYVTIAITAAAIVLIIFRKQIVSTIIRVKQHLIARELRNHRIATSMEIQGDPERTIESAIQQ